MAERKVNWFDGEKDCFTKKNLAGLILVPVNGIKTRWAAVTVSPINNGASPKVV